MLLCEDIAEQKVLLGSQLFGEQEKTLLIFLFKNKDVFAWTANDLCGVNRDCWDHASSLKVLRKETASAEVARTRCRRYHS
jgi:hypothetical protein